MTRKHKRWSRWCVMLVWAAVVGTSHGRADDAAPQAREQELVAVLRSETPEAEKAEIKRQQSILKQDLAGVISLDCH